jgi:hypothetical protein
MRNNKLTRAKKQHFVRPSKGVEVLKTSESRAKTRRFTFEADCQIIVSAHKNKDGLDIPSRVLPMRRLKLDAVSFATAKQAKQDCVDHEEFLRRSNPMMANSIIRVHAIPHETISLEALQQIQGYRDMSIVLDRALHLAIEEAQDVVSGKSVGSQFVCVPAQEAVGEPDTAGYTPAHPERSLLSIKEEYYRRALDLVKPKEQPNGIREGIDTAQTEQNNTDLQPSIITSEEDRPPTEEDERSIEPAADHAEIVSIQHSSAEEMNSDAVSAAGEGIEDRQ